MLNYSIVVGTRNKGEQLELFLKSSCKVLFFCCGCNNCIFFLLLLLLLRTLRSKVSILAASKTSSFAQVLLGLLFALRRKSNILFISTLLLSTALRSFPNLLLPWDPSRISSWVKSSHNLLQSGRFSQATTHFTKTSHSLVKPFKAILTNSES